MADNALGKAKYLCRGAYLAACSISVSIGSYGQSQGGPGYTTPLTPFLAPLTKLFSQNNALPQQPESLQTPTGTVTGGIRLG